VTDAEYAHIREYLINQCIRVGGENPDDRRGQADSQSNDLPPLPQTIFISAAGDAEEGRALP